MAQVRYTSSLDGAFNVLPITRFRFRSRSKVFGGQFSPASLFAAGEQGTWYDPSDLATLFEDSAGTIPVPSVLERPVGRILDKSGRGNHAFQTSNPSRPTLSARYNLLTKTEQFQDGAVWFLTSGVSITANSGLAPDGTTTADLMSFTSVSYPQVRQNVTLQANTSYTFSCYIKRVSGSGIGSFDIFGVGVINVAQQFTTTTNWQRVSVTGTTTAAGSATVFVCPEYEPTKTGSYLIWGADLRPTNDGVGIPAYQRVNTATDYDTTGFPPYLAFNGVDRWMQTATITPGTDKAQVFAGVRKLSDAAQGTVAEFSASLAANNGTFYLAAPNSAAANLAFASKGTAAATAIATPFAAPLTSVLTGLGDIAGDVSTVRVNGAATTDVTDQGTGNYLAYPMYIGRRGGTSLPYNGRIYSLITRFGPNLTAAQIASTETYVNTKTKAY